MCCRIHRRTFRFAYEAAGLSVESSAPSLLTRLFGGGKPWGTTDSANDRGFPDSDTAFLRSLSASLSGLGLTLPDKA